MNVRQYLCGLIVLIQLAALPVLRAVEPELHAFTSEGRNLHVFYPASHDKTKPVSVVLLFHGGGWSAGEASWTYSAAAFFVQQGMVAIPVEYRLADEANTPIESLQDACEAFRWVRRNAEQLGVRAERVAGFGVSAGGQLVAAAGTGRCMPAADTRYSAVPDAMLLWSPAIAVDQDGWFARLLKGKANPVDYSPLEHISAATSPTSIISGTADTLTPHAKAEQFCAQMKQHKRYCEVNAFPGLGHLLTSDLSDQENHFVVDPATRDEARIRLVNFLRKQGFLPDLDPVANN